MYSHVYLYKFPPKLLKENELPFETVINIKGRAMSHARLVILIICFSLIKFNETQVSVNRIKG